MDSIDSDIVVNLLQSIADAMVEQKSYLIELDSVVGDGDLGITMEKGFKAAAVLAAKLNTQDPGTMLMKAGMEIAKVAPSTMGTLMGTGFMRGGKAVVGKPRLLVVDVVQFFAAFYQGIADRGKAKLGDKTILDVLDPAVSAMKTYTGDDILELMDVARAGVSKGLETELGMMSQHGKAAVFREKTIGLQDPGSVAIQIMIEAFLKGIQK
ncbi:MAG: dihydroxyacetone kinase subunit L [Bacteroidia bacterium]|nr:dihydroxyacetone kinase subunit L [Bacteroidia bacterium]